MSENIFEKASRKKYRFNYKGQCTLEDLWDIKLEALDGMYIALTKELNEKKGVGLLETKNKKEEILEDKIKIIRHIVETKLQEQKNQEDATLRAERKQKILGMIADKQDQALEGKSIEELTKLVESLS